MDLYVHWFRVSGLCMAVVVRKRIAHIAIPSKQVYCNRVKPYAGYGRDDCLIGAGPHVVGPCL